MHVRRTALPALIAVAALAGCRTATMVLPAGLDAAAPLAVSGLNPRATGRPIDFGPYHVTVHEGWQLGQSVELLGFGVGRATKKYRLELAGGEAPATAACATVSFEIWRGSLSVELPVEPVLACSVTGTGGTAYLELKVDHKGVLTGSLSRGLDVYEVRSIHHLEGAAWRVGDPVGFALRRDGRAVAAAETINAGRVWLPPALDPGDRDVVAAALSALLFFTPAEAR